MATNMNIQSNSQTTEWISRRDALKLAGSAFASAAFASQVSMAAVPHTAKRVLIAGGGIGGLCCGYELMKRGHDVIVLEAAGRVGGHVFTVHDPLADGLYADGGAEHFTKPGYEIFRQYVDEFGLPAEPYPRRINMVRLISGKLYTEEMLADREVLKKFGFNRKELDYLAQHSWTDLPSLYYSPYLDAFEDEYQPFGVGLDDRDHMSGLKLLQQDGASGAAQSFIGGESVSALYELWHAAILKMRGVSTFPRELYRLRGGNQQLPNTFAAKLGERVRLGCPITHIQRGDTGVTVTYKEFGQEKTIDGDYLVNCIPLPAFSRIPVDPFWPDEKQFVIDGTSYGSYARVLLQSRNRFWEGDRHSVNMELGESALRGTWQMAHEVGGDRGLLMGSAEPGSTKTDALKAFRKHYPLPTDQFEQAYVLDWSQDEWAAACERRAFPQGELAQFWPNIMKPVGRVYFAGSYADNLNWGMEAATRSANRVALEIDQA